MEDFAIRPYSGVGGSTLTVRDAVAPIFRQRRVASAVFVVTLAGAVMWTVAVPSKYDAEMKILVNRDRVDAAVTPNAEQGAVPAQTQSVTEEELNSEVELLKSRDLLAQVVIACSLDAPSGSIFVAFVALLAAGWILGIAGSLPSPYGLAVSVRPNRLGYGSILVVGAPDATGFLRKKMLA
jgi:uncharacterized protein involved in exopolysaccharide biosynthesis